MQKEAATECPETQPDRKGEESNERATPQRCKYCEDLANCDTDFCMHWWH